MAGGISGWWLCGLLAVALLGVGGLRGQEAGVRGASAEATGVAEGSAGLSLEAGAAVFPPVLLAEGERGLRAAEAALRAGLPSLAEGLLRGILRDLEGSGDSPAGKVAALRREVQLELARSLVLQRRSGEAMAALAQVRAPPPPRYFLYLGLLHQLRNDLLGLEAALQRVGAEDLPPELRAWYFALEARQAASRGAAEEAGAAWVRAEGATVSAAQRSFLESFRLSGALTTGPVTPSMLDDLRRRVEAGRAGAVGQSFARQYAVALEAVGRRDEALELLQAQLRLAGPLEVEETALALALMGLIAGPETSRGQVALLDLLRGGAPSHLQQLALYQLASTVRADDRAANQGLLDALSAVLASGSSAVLDELLLLRAFLHQARRQPDAAMADAEALLERFPGSAQRVDALGLLAYLAWSAEPPRYRRAADYLSRQRELLPPGSARSEVTRLMADASFLRGDFAIAAEAYREAVALAVDPESPSLDEVRYQEVVALLAAGALDRALARLEGGSWPLRSEAWARAQWNALVALMEAGRLGLARERVGRLIAPVRGVDRALSWRLSWLAVYLAFEEGDWASVREGVVPGRAELRSARSGSEAELAGVIESHLRLLGAQAALRLGETAEGLAELAALRSDPSGGDAAVLAFFETARYLAERFQLADAQLLLRQLADTRPEHPSAPVALFEASLMADRQGLERTRQEAIDILATFLERYPQHPLVAAVIQQQGDIARKLERFDLALRYYEQLLQRLNASGQPRYGAQLAMAATLLAQATREPAKLDGAAFRLDLVLSDADSTPEALVEAGYLLGHVYRRQGNLVRSREILWRTVQRHLLEGAALTGSSRYWLARVLYDLAELSLAEGQPRDAVIYYGLIRQYGLPGSRLAEAQISSLGGSAAPSPPQ